MTVPHVASRALRLAIFSAACVGLISCNNNNNKTYSGKTGVCSVLVEGDVYLGGMFPYGPAWPAGADWDIITKQVLATINGSTDAFKGGKRLGILTCDGGCDEGLAADVFDELTGTGPGTAAANGIHVGAVIGPACTTATVKFIDKVKTTKIPIVAPAVESTIFTGYDDGDYFFRTAISAASYGPAHALYVKRVKMRSDLTIVYNTKDGWATSMAPLVKATFEAEGGTAKFVTFQHDDTTEVVGESVVSQLDVPGGSSAVMIIALNQPQALIFKASLTHTWVNPRPTLWEMAGPISATFNTVVNDNLAIDGIGGIESRPFDSAKRTQLLSGFEKPDENYLDKVNDAVYLAASALYLAEDPTNGEQVRNGLRKTYTGKVIEPGSWEEIWTELDASGQYNYQGISGLVDFDAEGDVQGNVWRWSYGANGAVNKTGCWDKALTVCP